MLENRTLFDVNLEKSGYALGSVPCFWHDKSALFPALDNLPQRKPIPILHCQISRCEQSAKGFTTDISSLKTNALFIAKPDNGQRKGNSDGCRPKEIDDLDG